MPQLAERLAREGDQTEKSTYSLLATSKRNKSVQKASGKRSREKDARNATITTGSALGPAWASKTDLARYISPEIVESKGSLKIHFNQRFLDILIEEGGKQEWQRMLLEDASTDHDYEHGVGAEDVDIVRDEGKRVKLRLSDGSCIDCDIIICAIGVDPNLPFIPKESNISRGRRGALLVNKNMETSIPCVWSAGDCCWIADQDTNVCDHNWMQMQLWSQAKAMGTLAAQCMTHDTHNSKTSEILAGVLFELFAHTTHFFGHKVVLLGRFNGQGLLQPGVEASVKEVVLRGDTKNSGCTEHRDLSKYRDICERCDGGRIGLSTSLYCDMDKDGDGDRIRGTEKENLRGSDVEIWTRITPGSEYVKLVIHLGRVVGALLIGETDLEETIENLILNRLDVSHLGIALLDPDIDIEDYFD